MFRFKYNGLHYPVFGSAVGWENGHYKSEMSRRFGGWANYDKWWSFSYGWKTKLSNPEKPLKQFVIDAVEANPELHIVWDWFEDTRPEQGGMWSVRRKSDGMYIGNILDAYYLAHLTQITHSMGFDPKEQKWYGWSHRAKFGFGIGSTVKPGDVAYKPRHKYELAETLITFYNGKQHDEKTGVHTTVIDTQHNVPQPTNQHVEDAECPLQDVIDEGVLQVTAVAHTSDPDILGTYVTIETTFFGPQDGRKGYTTDYWEAYPDVWGRGSWKAETLEDAYEMAEAFADGVS